MFLTRNLRPAAVRYLWPNFRGYNQPVYHPLCHQVPAATSRQTALRLPQVLHRLSSPFLTFLQFYGRQQQQHPWRTQILTSLAIYILGDANAQLLSPNSSSSYDFLRTLRMGSAGIILALPVHFWYTRISYAFSTLPTAAAIFARVAISQIVFSPVFLIAFFTLQGTMEGRGRDEVVERTKLSAVKAWTDGLTIWPLVSMVNFWMVPLEFRALVGGVVSLGWNTWLSYLNSKGTIEVIDSGIGIEEVILAVQAPKQALAESSNQGSKLGWGGRLLELELPILA